MGLANVTLKGTLNPGDTIGIGIQIAIEPHDAQRDAQNAHLLALGATPVSLTFTDSTPVPFGGDAVWKQTQALADGTWQLPMPTPTAIAYTKGARTDADLDYTRGGRYRINSYARVNNNPIIAITINEAAISGGQLDISAAICQQEYIVPSDTIFDPPIDVDSPGASAILSDETIF